MPDFKPLLDGRGLTGWHAYNKPGTVGDGWVITPAGELRLERPGETGGDIVTDETFTDFHLRLEWNVTEGANSGVFYRVVEGADDWAWMTGLEMQVLDDARHPDAQNGRDRLSGGLYGLYDVPDPSPIRPAGEWNAAEIILSSDRLRHVINGETIVDVDLNGDDFRQRVAASKFSKFPRFNKSRTGHIGLQDHGDVVTFRNIEIAQLD